MLKNLLARVYALVFPVEPTVDGIVATFNTTIAKLEAHADRKVAEMERLQAIIVDAEKAEIAAANEADKAAAVAAKIKELVS